MSVKSTQSSISVSQRQKDFRYSNLELSHSKGSSFILATGLRPGLALVSVSIVLHFAGSEQTKSGESQV